MKGGDPTVSVVVLGYEHEKFIRAAIESVLAQTCAPVEILLSDDASSDGTFGVMKEMASLYAGQHTVILNRNASNLGIAGHLNRAMELTSGELIIAAAGDDISRPDRVDEIVKVWQRSGKRAHLIHSAARRMSLCGRLGEIVRPPSQLRLGCDLPELIRGDLHVIGATEAWSRLSFDRFGPLNRDVVAEDRVFPVRAALLGSIAYIDQDLVAYREGGVSADFDSRSVEDMLFGSGLKWVRVFRASYVQQLKDLEKYGGSHEYEKEICFRRINISDFRLEIARATASRRLRLFITSAMEGKLTVGKCKILIKYLLPFFYSLVLRAKRVFEHQSDRCRLPT